MEIYKLTNIINGKCYIGKTERTLDIRWKSHVYDSLKRNYKSLINYAIRKYGPESFNKHVLYVCKSKNILDNMEILMIKEHHSHVSEGGYNMTYGGEGGDTFTNNPNKEEIRKRNSQSKIGRKRPEISGEKNPMKRPEVRLKSSKNHKGIKRNDILGDKNPAKREDVRLKISNALFGHGVSEKTRNKISKTKRMKGNLK